MIVDIKHPAVKHVNQLRSRPYRVKTGMVIVEGYPEVSRAVKAGVEVDELFICPDIFVADDKEFEGQNIVEVSREVFAEMAFGSRLKGILAICRPKELKLSDLTLRPNPCLIILENVEKPGNLGSVIRSCDGAGVDAVIMCEGKTDIYNQHVVRSSIGTIFTVPTIGVGQHELADYLKANDFRVFAASAKSAGIYSEQNFAGPVAVIVGNEHNGVSEFWIERADQMIKIPMHGQASSLNVTVSASILMYEILRQRNCD